MAQLTDVTAPYAPLESLLYDRLIAPAVVELLGRAETSLRVSPSPDADALDVGCGGGHLLVEMARRHPSARLTGLDLSAEQVARASRRTAELGERVRVVRGSALDLPFEDDSFDFVYSVASIKHWPDPLAGLTECVRVLRPGGTLLVVEADRGCTHQDAVGFVERWRTPRFLVPPATVFFRVSVAGRSLDLDDVRELAAALPLSDVRVERIPGTPGLALTGTA